MGRPRTSEYQELASEFWQFSEKATEENKK